MSRLRGALDPRQVVLRTQWSAGAELAASRGFTAASYQVVEDGGHYPCAGAIVDWCATLVPHDWHRSA